MAPVVVVIVVVAVSRREKDHHLNHLAAFGKRIKDNEHEAPDDADTSAR